MKSLAQTIARLQAFRAGQAPLINTDVDDRLSDLSNFGANPGALRSRFYIPHQLPQAAPLVVVLHGCTQTAAGYDHFSGWSELADSEGFALLFPEQQRANNANLCFNWFVPGDIGRDGGEALSIRQMVETFVLTHGIDRRRIFVTGLSAGGAMTAVMLSAYPDVFAGGAILSGLPYGSAATIPEAFESMRGDGGSSRLHLNGLVRGASTHKGPWPTVSVWQGSADKTVDPSNAAAIIGQWLTVHGMHKTPARTEIIDGHKRRVWSNSEGRVLIEEYIIAGMGHGAALKTTGDDGLGNAGPFMLNVGISSTRHIARFWGIVKSGENKAVRKVRAKPKAEIATVEKLPKPHLVKTRPLDQKERIPPSSPGTGVRAVIEDALRKAGLMR
ncbi:MAG: PHB depolymerase family esterase [Rhizobiales bacterium]|nr:PHB depolymerase family esterase [Hyphomicrobiales bacterium]